MMEQLIHWVRVDPAGLGRPQLPGDVPSSSMAVPMMMLCLVQQLSEGRGQETVQRYKDLSSWCVQQILQHVQVIGPVGLSVEWPIGGRQSRDATFH